MAFPASYQFCRDASVPVSETVLSGRVVDMSEGGLRLEGPLQEGVTVEELQRGALRLQIRVRVPEEIKGLCLVCSAQALNPADAAAAPQYVYGLKILQMSDDDRRILTLTLMRVTRAGSRGPLPEE
jgi:hypothetical protein